MKGRGKREPAARSSCRLAVQGALGGRDVGWCRLLLGQLTAGGEQLLKLNHDNIRTSKPLSALSGLLLKHTCSAAEVAHFAALTLSSSAQISSLHITQSDQVSTSHHRFVASKAQAQTIAAPDLLECRGLQLPSSITADVPLRLLQCLVRLEDIVSDSL